MSNYWICRYWLLMFLALSGLHCCSPNRDVVIKRAQRGPTTTPQETNIGSMQSVGSESDIWEGDSAGLHIKWTTHGLYVKRNAHVEELLTPLAQKGFEDFAKAYTAGNTALIADCQYDRNFTVVSIVGTVISIEDQYSDYCGGAHPSQETRFTTVDLAKTGEVSYATGKDTPMMDVDISRRGRIAVLTDYFSQEVILRALLDDKVVHKAISDMNVAETPRDLTALSLLFVKNYYELGNTGFELRPDFLTRFAFHHVEGREVAVRLGLPAHYGANRSQHMEIGLLLPITEALRQPLGLAAVRAQGYLMQDSAEIAKGKQTAFSIKSRKEKNDNK
jgi:hypothetical protein